MSKTRKTRPLMVRLADKNDHSLDLTEHHDHRNGIPCTLPDTVDAQLKFTHEEFLTLTCHYDWAYNGHGLCGCPMCTDRWGKNHKRKTERVEGKKEAAEGYNL